MPRNNSIAPSRNRVTPKWQPHWRAFTGAYKTTSPEYRISKFNAPMPPSYHRQILQFHGIFETTAPITFNVGQFVTVAIDGPGKFEGHSLYGFVYHVESSLWKGQREGYYWQMEVEVHTIPGYKIDWQCARPFVTPPIGTVFIQPHGFDESNFELLTQESPERWDKIRVDLGRKVHLFNITMRHYRMTQPESRLPTRNVYPRNSQHGLLVPVRTLLEVTQQTWFVEPVPPKKRPQPSESLTQSFDRDMEYLRSSDTRSTGKKRSFLEYVAIDDEEDERRIRRRSE